MSYGSDSFQTMKIAWTWLEVRTQIHFKWGPFEVWFLKFLIFNMYIYIYIYMFARFAYQSFSPS